MVTNSNNSNNVLGDIKATMDDVDYYSALSDRHALAKTFAESFDRDVLYVNTPYLKVLKEQFHSNISRLESADFISESNAYEKSLNTLFESLDKKLRDYNFQKNEGANLRGRTNLIREIVDTVATIKFRIRQRTNFAKSWIAKIESIANYFNVRVSKYVNLLTLGQNLSVDFPQFSLSDVDGSFLDEYERAMDSESVLLARVEEMFKKYGFDSSTPVNDENIKKRDSESKK